MTCREGGADVLNWISSERPTVGKKSEKTTIDERFVPIPDCSGRSRPDPAVKADIADCVARDVAVEAVELQSVEGPAEPATVLAFSASKMPSASSLGPRGLNKGAAAICYLHYNLM